MRIILFSYDLNLIIHWEKNINSKALVFDNITALKGMLEEKSLTSFIVVCDYDSVANDINKLISSNILPENVVVLERVPEIATGRMLISHNVKAYGNSKMLKHHFDQMLRTVRDGNIWTYPELTVSLIRKKDAKQLSDDAKELIQNRLSKKEIQTLYNILEGLNNEAIASIMSIKQRTVKAHTSSI
ncbi:MAG: response regulator transcription factor, partial [Sulfurimonas sp.]|nr:response regulator transcription factor [Sulfurimonas sp.]